MPSLVWIILPYGALLSFAGGHLWRARHDGFRRFTSGADLDQAERIGSTAFGIATSLIVVARITDSLTSAPPSQPQGGVYSSITIIEVLAIPPAIIGAALLVIPNLITATAGRPITPLDRATLPTLAAVLLSGVAIRLDSIHSESRSPQTLFAWFRSLLTTHPHADSMSHAPLLYQARGLILLLFVAIWPYTRLAGTFARPVASTAKRIASRLTAQSMLPAPMTTSNPSWTDTRPTARRADPSAAPQAIKTAL